jgi:hypothetical protein
MTESEYKLELRLCSVKQREVLRGRDSRLASVVGSMRQDHYRAGRSCASDGYMPDPPHQNHHRDRAVETH